MFLKEKVGRMWIQDGKTSRDVSVKAVPYFAWCNREPGEMIVWIQEEN